LVDHRSEQVIIVSGHHQYKIASTLKELNGSRKKAAPAILEQSFIGAHPRRRTCGKNYAGEC
jgi:hypothetical protein